MSKELDDKIDEAIRRVKMVYLSGRYNIGWAPDLFDDALKALEKLKINNKKLNDEQQALELEYLVHGTAIVIISQKFILEINARDENDQFKAPFYGRTQNFDELAKELAHELGLDKAHLQVYRGQLPGDAIRGRGKFAHEGIISTSEDEHTQTGKVFKPFDPSVYKASGFYPIESKPAPDYYFKLYQTQERERQFRKIGRMAFTLATGILIVPLFFTIPWLIRKNAEDDLSRAKEDIQRITLSRDEYKEFKNLRAESKKKSVGVVAEATIGNNNDDSTRSILYTLSELKWANKPQKYVCTNKEDSQKIDIYMDKEQVERFKLFRAKHGEALTPEDLESLAKHSPMMSSFTLSKK